MYNPNMNSNFIAEVRAEWNFERSYIIANENYVVKNVWETYII